MLLPVSAEQIYKCTTEKGQVSFQSSPCAVTQGKAETIDIDNEADPNYVPETFPEYSYPSHTTKKSSGTSRAYKKAKRERDKKVCQIYKDALTNAEIKWKNVRTQGYRQWEQELYTENIRKAKQAVKRNCN